VAYLASVDYDPRDVPVCRVRNLWARAGLDLLEILRELPGEHTLSGVDRAEFARARGRHINSVEQLTWQHVTEGRPHEDWWLWSWGVEWTTAKPFEAASSIRRTADLRHSARLPEERRHSNLFAAGRTADATARQVLLPSHGYGLRDGKRPG